MNKNRETGAWDIYKVGNGVHSFEDFIARMEGMLKTNLQNKEIGCIILSNFKVFSQPVLLSEIGIDFQNSTVLERRLDYMKLKNLVASV